jgi:hypothetical protein
VALLGFLCFDLNKCQQRHSEDIFSRVSLANIDMDYFKVFDIDVQATLCGDQLTDQSPQS